MSSDVGKTLRGSCVVLAVVAAVASCSPKKAPSVERASSALSTSNGILENGLTTNGLWGNGLWGNGLWGNGLWGNGLWGNGLWGNGQADNGLWGNGLWGNGLWGNGLWGNGLWGNGLWGNGQTDNGLWGNGLWGNGLWGNGLWGNGLSSTGGPPQEGSPAALLQQSKYLRQLLQYVYQCAMPGELDPITNTRNQTSYDTSLDPWGGTLPCTETETGQTCPDETYTCTRAGTCVIPLKGAVGVAINADGSSWWGEAANGTYPDYTQSTAGGLAGSCDESCQRWVSACVLARTNAYGVHVEISMRAPANAPQAIKNALKMRPGQQGNPSEEDLFDKREGAYYGNIFATTPVPNTPPSPGYTGPATGAIALTPIYTACAGPESNVPQLTKRFESSQGDQVVIGVPGVCLATANEPGACAGSDTNESSPTFRSIQHCYTKTSLQVANGANACATILNPRGIPEPADPSCYDQVITVFLAEPIAVCGNLVCEPPSETPTCCPTDCHPSTWAKDFSPHLQTGSSYVAPACSARDSVNGNCPTAPPIKFSPNGMSALAADSSIAVVGNSTVDICSGSTCPLHLGDANLPASLGVGVLVKYNADGSYAWPANGDSTPVGAIRFGATPPLSYVNALNNVFGVVVGTNGASAPTRPDHTGNITVAGVTTQVGSSNQKLWFSTFSPDGAPLGTWIPELVGGPTLEPYGATLAFDSQSNLVLALNATNLVVQPTTTAIGGNSSCAILSGGQVECWGQNGYTLATSTEPVIVPGLTGATAVSIMNFAACALIADGTVKCWGANSQGELGNGTTAGSPTPVTVPGLTGVKAIASAGFSTCALLSAGTVKCWGTNAYGQLGNGVPSGPSQCSPTDPTSICSRTPVDVRGPGGPLIDITAISVAQYHSCALGVGGQVYCWGSTEFGRLGNGGSGGLPCASGACMPTATLVLSTLGGPGTLTDATAISVGLYSTCALMPQGNIACWGDNSQGELGLGFGSQNGPTTCGGLPCSPIPAMVTGLTTPATAISVGVNFACALLSNGTVNCWGDNSYGSLGTGGTGTSENCRLNHFCVTTPAPVIGLTDVTSIAPSGALNTCVRVIGGAVKCWGDNYFGSLGNGIPTSPEICASGTPCATSPVVVSTPSFYSTTNTLVLKTSLPAGSAEAPVMWVAPLGGASSDTVSFPQSLAIDPNNNVVVVSAGTLNGLPQGILRKICADGSFGPTCPDGSAAWTNAGAFYTAAAIQPTSMSSSDIFAAGVAYSSTGLYGVPFLQKFDTNGTVLWSPLLNRSTGTCPYVGSSVASSCMSQPPVQGVNLGFDGGNNVVLASFGNPAVGGGINFGMGPTFPTYGSPNIFLSAYDSILGTVQWAKQIQTILSGSLHGMALGNQGQVIVAGNYSGSMQVDGQLLVTAAPESPGVVDSFLASFAQPTPVAPEIGTTSGTCGGTSFATLPENIYVPATSPAGACVFFMPPTSTWATTVTCSPPPNTTFPIGPTEVKCKAYDAYGNSASADSFTVNVFDPPGPVLTKVPANITRVVAGPTAITYTPPTVIEQLNNPEICSACGQPTPCEPPPVFANCTPASGATFQMGPTTVSCTTTDARNRTASASFTVTLIPQVTASCVGSPGAPVIIATAPGTCGVVVGNTSPVAGTCGGGAQLQSCTFDGQASKTLGPGNHAIQVVATALDLSTTATCTSYIQVVDNVNPAITCPAATAQCTGNGGATVTPAASCTDNCSCTKSCTTGFFQVGTSVGSCTATDPAGHTASCQPSVTVVDTLGPVVTPRTGPSTVQCNVDTWSDPGATAVDQCVGDLSGGVSASGSVDPTHVGSYTKTYSASDPSGNVGSATRVVNVVDTLTPTTSATVSPTPSANRTVTIKITSYSITPKGGGTPITGSATCWSTSGMAVALKAVDACSIKQITYALSGAQTGGATVTGGLANVTVTAPGSTTLAYYATDSAGNKENVKTLPLFVGGTQGVPYVCSPAVTNLPPHGTVTAQGTVTVTNSKSGKTTTFPFSFTHSY